jgi:NTE family protein
VTVTWWFVSKVGLILGGGGVTGASWELATLLALEMATGWTPNSAEVVVGTSAGSYVAAIVRGRALSLDSIVRPADTNDDVASRIRSALYRRAKPWGFRRWIKYGVLPGLRHPGLHLVLGSPAPYDPSGIGRLVIAQIGAAAYAWPVEPTVLVAYDMEARRLAPFGTVHAPDVALCDAVAASSAVPVIFNPYEIDGRLYVDGGVVSGTHADLVLGRPEPLDLVLILAPMAAEEARTGATFYENLFDRVGIRALQGELELIEAAWPNTDVLVLRPGEDPMEVMRPNPMSSQAAVPSFIRSLHSLRSTLARPEIWSVLEHHLHRPAVTDTHPPEPSAPGWAPPDH